MSRAARWGREEFALDPQSLARALLGQRLVRVLADGTRLAGSIVETEAYLGVPDKAAHSFGGHRSARNESMYQRAGTAYVYFTYGMHFCMNVVCGNAGDPVAVLLRAMEPTEGLDAMRGHRGARRSDGGANLRDTDLCSGPAKLCQALQIDRALDGEDLVKSRVLSVVRVADVGFGARAVGRSPRIGIGSAEEWEKRRLRWFSSGNPHVSR